MSIKLPKGIKSMSLVDVSHLNLDEEATSRVAMKISEIVLSEYASKKKAPKGMAIVGSLANIELPEWVGYILIDKGLVNSSIARIGDSLVDHIHQNEIATPVMKKKAKK